MISLMFRYDVGDVSMRYRWRFNTILVTWKPCQKTSSLVHALQALFSCKKKRARWQRLEAQPAEIKQPFSVALKQTCCWFSLGQHSTFQNVFSQWARLWEKLHRYVSYPLTNWILNEIFQGEFKEQWVWKSQYLRIAESLPGRHEVEYKSVFSSG